MKIVLIGGIAHYEVFCAYQYPDLTKSCKTFCGENASNSLEISYYREEEAICPICKPFIIMNELAK